MQEKKAIVEEKQAKTLEHVAASRAMDAQTTSEKLRQLRDTYAFAMSLDPAARGDMAEKALGHIFAICSSADLNNGI